MACKGVKSTDHLKEELSRKRAELMRALRKEWPWMTLYQEWESDGQRPHNCGLLGQSKELIFSSLCNEEPMENLKQRRNRI